ncbi:MAG TPA: CHASE3 domain-containing protein [Acidobacteriaceae bacterium]
MKWSVGVKIGSTFALVWLLLLAIGITSYRSSVQLIETAGLVAHGNQVRFALTELLSHLQDTETGQRGFVLTGLDNYLEPYTSGLTQIPVTIQRMRQLTADNPNQQRRLDALEPLISQKFGEESESIALRRTKGSDAAVKVVLTQRGKVYMDQIRKVVADMDKEEADLLVVRQQEANQKAEGAKRVIIAGTSIAFLVSLLCAVVLTLHIAGPLARISSAAERIAVGDLSAPLPQTNRSDEVGALTRTFSRMAESLKEMAELARKIAIGNLTVVVKPQSDQDLLGTAFASMVTGLRDLNREIREGVTVLASSASEILATTAQVTAGASETATSVSQTTSTVEEVKQTAQVASEKARYVSDNAQKSAQISQTGKKSVDETIACMTRISEQMDLIGEGIMRLSEQGQAIGEIMASVNDLAEQSNLLAVNASIEAAKAGEHGKGFAVVAQEVRSLAQQSKQATAQVRTILGDFQKATSAAVLATEQGVKAVDLGVKQSGETSDAIRMLADSIAEAAQAAAQIAASSQQQRVGMDQVALAMENIKQASLQNVSSTKQGESAAMNLHTLGQKMKQLVEQYQI